MLQPAPAAQRRPLALALIDAFDQLPDPRVERTRLHRLADILLLSLAAFCCGAEGFEDIEDWAEEQGEEPLRRDLGARLDHGIPHHDTFRRVLGRLNPLALEASLHTVRHHLLPGQAAGQAATSPEHIALDGKELRGSHDAAHQSEALLLLSAFATDWNLVLGQRRGGAKTNEIPTAVAVLSQIALAGATVTADALHCQRETARAIRERGGDYLLAVKENQHTLHQALIGLFETNRQHNRLPMEQARTLEKDHGRIELRQGFLIRARDWLPSEDPLWEQWGDLSSVLCLEYERWWTHRGQKKTSRFVRYFISSSTASVEQHMAFARSHWKIENCLHWVMDVTFGEDASRVRCGQAVQNLATLRRCAAFLLRQSTPKGGRKGAEQTSLRRRKKIAGWSRAYLIQTLAI